MPFLLWYMTTFRRQMKRRGAGDLPSRTRRIPAGRARPFASRWTHHEPNALTGVATDLVYPESHKAATEGQRRIECTAAWVMGQDNQSTEFRKRLQKHLTDANTMVRRNAALSHCDVFEDPQPRHFRMLAPYSISAPRSGTLATQAQARDVIKPGNLVPVAARGKNVEMRSDVPGTIAPWIVPDGAQVQDAALYWLRSKSEMVVGSLRACN